MPWWFNPLSIADFGLKSRRARRSRPTGGRSRAGMPVAPCRRLSMRAPWRGIVLKRGLLVRRGRGEHGAAHAPAHWQAGLEARAPRERRAPRGPCAWVFPLRPWRETQKTACGIGHAHFLHSIQHSKFKIGRRQPPLCASAPLRENRISSHFPPFDPALRPAPFGAVAALQSMSLRSIQLSASLPALHCI